MFSFWVCQTHEATTINTEVEMKEASALLKEELGVEAGPSEPKKEVELVSTTVMPVW